MKDTTVWVCRPLFVYSFKGNPIGLTSTKCSEFPLRYQSFPLNWIRLFLNNREYWFGTLVSQHRPGILIRPTPQLLGFGNRGVGTGDEKTWTTKVKQTVCRRTVDFCSGRLRWLGVTSVEPGSRVGVLVDCDYHRQNLVSLFYLLFSRRFLLFTTSVFFPRHI